MCFLAGWGIQALLVAIITRVMMSAYLTPTWFLAALLVPLTSHTGTIVGMIAVRGRFSRTRLALGISAVWVLVAMISVGMHCSIFGFRWAHAFASYALQQDILYIIGFWSFVAFIPWWRERVFRAYGVTPSV